MRSIRRGERRKSHAILHQAPTGVDPAGAAARARQAARQDDARAGALYRLALESLTGGRTGEAEAALRALIAGHPGHAGAHAALGLCLHLGGDDAHARTELERAVALDPMLAEAWNTLGVVQQRQGELDAAARSLERALALRPDFADAHCNLASVLLARDRWEEAADRCRKALRAAPAHAAASYNLGNALRDAGRLDEALQAYDRALELDPANANARYNRGLTLLLAGRLAEGWRDYAFRFRKQDEPLPEPPQPHWDGAIRPRHTLAVHVEQGLGDAIQFLRYLPAARERVGRLVLVCPPELARLCAYGVAGIDEVSPCGAPVEADLHLPLLALGALFSPDLERIPRTTPYVTVDEALRERFAALLPAGPELRIGIAWAGNPAHRNDRNRSCRLEDFAPIAALPAVRLVSLQKGPAAAQIAQARLEVMDAGALLGDLADTAALIANLDLVISVDSAVAHLAGALGKPAWVMIPPVPDWRWMLDREDSPWYPQMRLFRGREPGRWRPVLERMAQALRAAAGLDASVAVPGALRDAEGRPRFVLPLPASRLRDPGLAYLVEHETRFGGYEFPTRRFLDRHLAPGDVFIDVGAHCGIFTLGAATIHRGAVDVLAIEPDPQNLGDLRAAIEHNGLRDTVEIVAAACANAPGRGWLAEDTSMGHRLAATGDAGTAEVEVTSIDALLRARPRLAGRRIFMKIDVEGAEPQVLEGARETLAGGRVAAVIVERGAAYDDAPGRARLLDALAALFDAGFSAWRFAHENAGGPLLPYLANDERCNVLLLAPGFEPAPLYDKPPGALAPPVPRAPDPLPGDRGAAFTQRLLLARATDAGRWADPVNLPADAGARAARAARHVPAGSRVLDLGAGAMALRAAIAPDCGYQAVDLVARCADALVMDFNQGAFPPGSWDCVAMLDLLAFLHAPGEFLVRARAAAPRLILTYPLLRDGDGDIERRRAQGWFNDFNREQLDALLAAAGWQVQSCEDGDAGALYACVDPLAQAGPCERDRRKARIREGRTDIERWSDPTQLEAAWELRAALAGRFLPAGATVLDLGCGAMALERHLPAGCEYRPCDLVARDARTAVCDFNAGGFPDARGATHLVALGVLEYLYDPDAFLARLRACDCPVILSYCPADLDPGLDREGLGWVNHLTHAELAACVHRAGFALRAGERIDDRQVLLRLEPGARPALARRRALVLSYNNVGNFGDRLGYHLMQSLLPPQVEVVHAHFDPWDVPAGDFDLVVVGAGNSLFGPLLTDALLELLDRTPASIGIFGTQYRRGIDRTRLDAVLDRLSAWLGRYEEDLLLYGRGRANAAHFGDWLAHAFPLARGTRAECLSVGAEIWQDLPLDRTIQTIQSYRQVHSSRVHPLLCALTSAERVAYREQREGGGGDASGKFHALLHDVFGRSWPEDTFFDVDRDAVIRYKRKVAANVADAAVLVRRLLDLD
ncbi:MAG: FkbM family methyltransferase [Gammaproteobacteria bacterium]